VVLDGKLFHGKTGNGGHIGHVCVEPDGPVCACGARGCLEAVASGPSSVRYALAQGWSPGAGAVADGRTLGAAAQAGDPVAIDAVTRSGRAVGLVLASCANFLDLEMAVVAGGFSRTGDLFWHPLQEVFAQNAVMSHAREMVVRHSQGIRSTPLIGAAAFILVPDRYGW
jgi:glucokinase